MGRKTTGVKWHPYHTKCILSRVHSISMTYHCWCWSYSPGWVVLTGFSTVKLIFYSPFHTVLFGKKSLCATNTLRSRELRSTSFRAKYLHKLFEIRGHLSLLPHLLFIQSIYISMNSWIFTLYFALKLNVLVTLFQFGHCEHFKLVPVSFDVSPSLWVYFVCFILFLF